MILDDENSFKSVNNISDQKLIEILNGGKSYPKFFIEKAKQELINRNVKLEYKNLDKDYESEKIVLKDWIKQNRKLSLLILLTSFLSGIVGFFIVSATSLTTIYSNSKYDRRKNGII